MEPAANSKVLKRSVLRAPGFFCTVDLCDRREGRDQPLYRESEWQGVPASSVVAPNMLQPCEHEGGQGSG